MTALTATLVPAVGDTVAPMVRVNVTGAPPPPGPVYSSNFATADGWTTSDGYIIPNSPAAGSAEFQSNPTGSPPTTFDRAVTGLSAGNRYLYRVQARGNFGEIAASAVNAGVSTASFRGRDTGITLDVEFVAGTASETLRITLQKSPGSPIGADYYIDKVTLQQLTGWPGTHLYRTDANGTDVPVRVDPDAEEVNASGALTVWDFEAALTGTVSYTVVDGAGVSTTGTVAATAPQAWLSVVPDGIPSKGPTAPPSAAAVPLVTGYTDATASIGQLHQIIDRRDPVGNPGPHSLRTGSLELFAQDFAQALAIREQLLAGDVVLLRQPTYPGMDAYLVATRAALAAADPDLDPMRWLVSVDFTEVARP